MNSVASPSSARLHRGAAGTKAVVLLALAAGFSGLAMADPAAIARCRQESDSLLRLRCYDAIPLPAAGASASAPKPVAGAPGGSAAPAAAGAAPTTAAAATVANAASATSPAAQFGLENRRPPEQSIESIESYIPGRVDGWTRNTRFKLANGQIWEIRDNSPAAYNLNDPKVRIVRGVSGSFFMEIAGVSQTPRVRRVE